MATEMMDDKNYDANVSDGDSQSDDDENDDYMYNTNNGTATTGRLDCVKQEGKVRALESACDCDYSKSSSSCSNNNSAGCNSGLLMTTMAENPILQEATLLLGQAEVHNNTYHHLQYACNGQKQQERTYCENNNSNKYCNSKSKNEMMSYSGDEEINDHEGGRTSRMSMNSDRAMSMSSQDNIRDNSNRAHTPSDVMLMVETVPEQEEEEIESITEKEHQNHSNNDDYDATSSKAVDSTVSDYNNNDDDDTNGEMESFIDCHEIQRLGQVSLLPVEMEKSACHTAKPINTLPEQATDPEVRVMPASHGLQQRHFHEQDHQKDFLNIGKGPVSPSASTSMRISPATTSGQNGIIEGSPLSSFLSKILSSSPERALERLSHSLSKGRLVMINFSQRNLGHRDAELLRVAILANPQLGVLKLSYNNLGNIGANIIASAISCGGELTKANDNSEPFICNADSRGDDRNIPNTSCQCRPSVQTKQCCHHHPSLSVLDLGFNNVGDEGCSSLASLAVKGNSTLSTLYLAGNAVRVQGSLALADAIASGCGLTSLHLTANQIGPHGVKGLMRALAEFDVTLQMLQQDRENRRAMQGVILNNKNSTTQEICLTNDRDYTKSDLLSSQGICDIQNGNDHSDDFSRLSVFKCMEELYLGGTKMQSTGCLSVSNMLLTNLSLRVICLSDNGLNDQDLSLFSQSLSRNRQLPLETLRLSFNKLTCVGVETLMNAIWGSKTLREIKLDNNQIRDRGAQLAAVVLTSVDLEVLDIGFNRLTILGIKALMKSLAENSSLLSLTLSGNILDTNASKAVSYALAYNRTIRRLYLDHCSLNYAAQRHIAAGIVSNSNLALRVMSGFPLGAISVTLGLPSAMENWSNEQVLKFIRIMWDRNRQEQESTNNSSNQSNDLLSSAGKCLSPTHAGTDKSNENVETKVGPSDPATVVAAAKSAFATLENTGGMLVLTEEPQRAISDTSPMVSSDAVLLEKTLSGTVRVPNLDDSENEFSHFVNHDGSFEACLTNVLTDTSCASNGIDFPESPADSFAKKRNNLWMRLHLRSLHEMILLPYVHADLIQLYHYFYSPVDSEEDASFNEGKSSHNLGAIPTTIVTTTPKIENSSMDSQVDRQLRSTLQRKQSYQGLHAIMSGHGNLLHQSPNYHTWTDNNCKRRPVSAVEGCNQPMQPALKRARNDKPRIDYFPRIKSKIDWFLSTTNHAKALTLLRQLKFVETTMFFGSTPYCDQSPSLASASSDPVAADAEVILIDMM